VAREVAKEMVRGAANEMAWAAAEEEEEEAAAILGAAAMEAMKQQPAPQMAAATGSAAVPVVGHTYGHERGLVRGHRADSRAARRRHPSLPLA